ncbi:MAG: hypothetical protein ABIB97_04720 [Patescibacteria group bacterium]
MLNSMSLAERWVAVWPMYKGWFVAAIIAVIIVLYVTRLVLRNMPRSEIASRKWIHSIRWTVIMIIALVLGLNLFNSLSVNLSERRGQDRTGIEQQKEALDRRIGDN